MKLAFIVQPDWLSEHFGVRNLFVSVAKTMQRAGHDTDFIFFDMHRTEQLWYRFFVDDADLYSKEKETTDGLNQSYEKLSQPIEFQFRFYKQFIGTSADTLYDAFIITNPWLLNAVPFLGSGKKILLCYDVVANKYAFDNPGIFPWGYAHNAGYVCAKKEKMHFLSISKAVDDEIDAFYSPDFHTFLPPIRPYAFFDAFYDSKRNKENAVILAAPFDVRKGLNIIPDLINPLADCLETLYIFGTPRCGRELYDDFFKKIKIGNIVYYNRITSDDLIALYQKCKVLLFPSLNEGLGLPLIEAQLCGCRAVTTNAEPMNTLLCSGGYLLSDNNDKNISAIHQMLQDDTFDYESLSHEADLKFSQKKVVDTIETILF